MTDIETGPPRRGTAALLLIGGWATLSVLALWPATAAAAEDQTPPTRSWQHQANAMTLDLPPGCQPLAEIPGGALVRFVGPGGEEDYAITVSVKSRHLERPEDILDVRRLLDVLFLKVVAAQLSDQVIIDQNNRLKVGPYDASYIYFWVADRQRTPLERIARAQPGTRRNDEERWVMGQAFVQIGLATVATFELEVDADRFDTVRPTFEALFKSLRLDLVRLAEQRKELVAQFTEWRGQLDTDKWHAVCVAEQWYRIVDDNRDVGYTHVRQQRATRLNMPGLEIRIESHVSDGTRSVDSKSEFFLADDRETEYWSIQMTDRPLRAKKRPPTYGKQELTVSNRRGEKLVTRKRVDRPPDTTTWVETGLRAGDLITVSRQSAVGDKEYQWQCPQYYLSQVELYLLRQLATTTPWQELGFYAYFPSVGRITFHSQRLERRPDDGYRLFARPTPDTPPTITTYNHTGRFLSQTIPGGRNLLPASRAQIAARWQKR